MGQPENETRDLGQNVSVLGLVTHPRNIAAAALLSRTNA